MVLVCRRQFFEKIFFSDEAHFILGVSYLDFWEYSSNWRDAITSRNSHCLVRSLGRRCDWTLFLRKRRWDDCHRQFVALWSYDNWLFLPANEEYNLGNMWFQQDGATYHTTRAKMALSQETFSGRVISRRGDINWLPISCD